MNILISGGTGLIGGALSVYLSANGHKVAIISRTPQKTPESHEPREISWDELGDSRNFFGESGVDGIINLAGENLGSGRWTAAKKKRILQSRLSASDKLVNAIRQSGNKPSLFIQSSAIGYYGTDREQQFDESSPAGNDYLAGVAQQWESSSSVVEDFGLRRVVIRTGVVLSTHSGALARLLLPFRLFLGGPLGSGNQWISWIHLDDVVRAIAHVINEPSISGAINLTAPNPVTNAEFGRAIADVIGRPYWLPVPGFALKTILGEMSVMVLKGQKVIPGKLVETGFEFSYPDLKDALQNLILE